MSIDKQPSEEQIRIIRQAEEAKRRILGQPAEAEGAAVQPVAWRYTSSQSFGRRDRRWHYQETFPEAGARQVQEIGHLDALVRESDHLAALSAVTAERDRLREERDSQQRVCIAEMEKVNQLRDEIEALRVLLIDARELIEHGDFREGHCMCGSAVDGHTFGDGHTPCDAGEYYAGQVRERIDAAMAAKEA